MERRRVIRGTVLVLALIGLLWGGIVLWQWWSRPAVVHYDNLKYIQLLRTACSSQQPTYVDGVEKALQMRREEGALSDHEWREFAKIITMARGGQWQSADRAAYRLELGQLQRSRTGTSPSHSHDDH